MSAHQSHAFRRELPSPVGPHPLDALITPERAHKYRQVLARRTTRIAVVVEDCYDPHNATAVMRTCDAFGLHRVHVTTSRNAFKINRRVSQGTHRYLDLRVHGDIESCYAELRRDGYRILVSDLAADAMVGPAGLREAVAEGPVALVFGSEGEGVSAAASAGADGYFLVPMQGFAQSLNVSVTAATTLYAVREEALSSDEPGNLDTEAQHFWFERWVEQLKGPAARKVMAEADSDDVAEDARAVRESGRKGEDLDVYRG